MSLCVYDRRVYNALCVWFCGGQRCRKKQRSTASAYKVVKHVRKIKNNCTEYTQRTHSSAPMHDNMKRSQGQLGPVQPKHQRANIGAVKHASQEVKRQLDTARAHQRRNVHKSAHTWYNKTTRDDASRSYVYTYKWTVSCASQTDIWVVVVNRLECYVDL